MLTFADYTEFETNSLKLRKNVKALVIQARFFSLLLGVFLLVSAPASVSAMALFNSSESKSTGLQSFTKWTSMLDRVERHQDKTTTCKSRVNCREQWESFIASIKNLPPLEQIRRVNQYHNQTRYVQDIVNWGMNDFWATPFEFFGKNGDCEDYAIAKYISLKKLGFDVDNMRVVVSQDTNLRIMHSVLAVYQGDKIYILDNQIQPVIEHTSIYHYKPIYSINEHAWWRHL